MSTSGKQNDAEWTVEKAIPSSLTDQIISASSEPEIVLCFLSIIHLLKAQRRTGWIVRNIESAESIADHMYRMSIITFLIKDSNVDKNRMAKIAIVHDMAEAIVGDITPTDPVPKSEKHRRELASMVYLSKLIEKVNPAAAEELMHLWLEYENIASLEARYVKDIDKYELMVQALDYEKRDNCSIDLSDLYSVRNKIETAEVASWADEVLHQRRKLWNECKGINPPSNSK